MTVKVGGGAEGAKTEFREAKYKSYM